MINPDEETIIGDICDYAERKETRKMLEDYMVRMCPLSPLSLSLSLYIYVYIYGCS